jgi:hypothetical protein
MQNSDYSNFGIDELFDERQRVKHPDMMTSGCPGEQIKNTRKWTWESPHANIEIIR